MRTSPFGDISEPYDGIDVYYDDTKYCECCGEVIPPDEMAFYVKANYYCKNCEDAAKDAIFEEEKFNYLVEVA